MPRLKRWESPRREGRNDKGKGGSAKKKQWQKRLKMLKSKLKNSNNGEVKNFPFFMAQKLIINITNNCQNKG
ncbi:hypothetical protein [Geminocystis herdmanii]|uniref:hypothetical protein n=1 Tax=Geminocystis herdmanii TaxID=669359 RepID=UPI0003497BED|nr:hypothetical protein [Geminocystis herdmanii]